MQEGHHNWHLIDKNNIIFDFPPAEQPVLSAVYNEKPAWNYPTRLDRSRHGWQSTNGIHNMLMRNCNILLLLVRFVLHNRKRWIGSIPVYFSENSQKWRKQLAQLSEMSLSICFKWLMQILLYSLDINSFNGLVFRCYLLDILMIIHATSKHLMYAQKAWQNPKNVRGNQPPWTLTLSVPSTVSLKHRWGSWYAV